MQQEYEIIGYPKIRHLRIFIDEVRYRSPHLHRDYEFCFALKGGATFAGLRDSFQINADEILFFDSNEVHSIQTENEAIIALFVQVSNHFLRDYLPELHSKLYRCGNLSDYLGMDEQKSLFQKALMVAKDYFAETPGYRASSIAFMLELMNVVLRGVPHEELSQKDIDTRNRNARRISRLVAAIDENLDGPLRLKDLAESEHITPTHLSHLFSESLGVTFQEYVNQRRLERAVQLLSATQKRITDIAFEAGFSDPKYMTAAFRLRFHCTPNEFRQQNNAPQLRSSTKDKAILERIYQDKEALRFLEELTSAN